MLLEVFWRTEATGEAPALSRSLSRAIKCGLAGSVLAQEVEMRIKRVLIGIVAITSLSLQLRGEESISRRFRVELALRDYAKLMCSAVFISGRDLTEAERDSGPLVTEN